MDTLEIHATWVSLFKCTVKGDNVDDVLNDIIILTSRERHGVSNHQPLDSLFSGLFRLISNRKCQDYVYIKWEYWSTMKKMEHYFRHENKVIINKVLSYCEALRCETTQNNKNVAFPSKSCLPLKVNKLGSLQSKYQSPHHWSLCKGKFAGHRWIPLTRGQWCCISFHIMTSWCDETKKSTDLKRITVHVRPYRIPLNVSYKEISGFVASWPTSYIITGCWTYHDIKLNVTLIYCCRNPDDPTHNPTSSTLPMSQRWNLLQYQRSQAMFLSLRYHRNSVWNAWVRCHIMRCDRWIPRTKGQ